MEVLLIIVIFVIIPITVEALASLVVHGYYNPKKIHQAIERELPKGVRVVDVDYRIIRVGGLPYISTAGIGIVFKYYMSDVGVIPRWSKAHKLIKQIMKSNLKVNKEKLLGL